MRSYFNNGSSSTPPPSMAALGAGVGGRRGTAGSGSFSLIPGRSSSSSLPRSPDGNHDLMSGSGQGSLGSHGSSNQEVYVNLYQNTSSNHPSLFVSFNDTLFFGLPPFLSHKVFASLGTILNWLFCFRKISRVVPGILWGRTTVPRISPALRVPPATTSPDWRARKAAEAAARPTSPRCNLRTAGTQRRTSKLITSKSQGFQLKKLKLSSNFRQEPTIREEKANVWKN